MRPGEHVIKLWLAGGGGSWSTVSFCGAACAGFDVVVAALDLLLFPENSPFAQSQDTWLLQGVSQCVKQTFFFFF